MKISTFAPQFKTSRRKKMEKDNKFIEATAMATGTATATRALERSDEDKPILRDVSEVINELSSAKAV